MTGWFARFLIAWDRKVMFLWQEDEQCGDTLPGRPLITCQRRYAHKRWHAMVVDSTDTDGVRTRMAATWLTPRGTPILKTKGDPQWP